MSNIYRCQFTGKMFSDEASKNLSEQEYLKTQVDNVFIDDALTFKTGTENKSPTNQHVLNTAKKIMQENSVLFERLAAVEKKELEGAMKFDSGKIEWHLLPLDAMEEVMKVLMMGKKKYGDFNWLNEPTFNYTRLYNSGTRHRNKFIKGQDFDEESGLYELAHSIANDLFLLTYMLRNKGIDDRIKIMDKNGLLKK